MFELRPYSHRNNALYNPFKEMDELEKQFFNAPFGFYGGHALDEFKTDIKDEGDRYELEADLPGFAKKDIHLDISGDVLTIRAERHSEHEENAGGTLVAHLNKVVIAVSYYGYAHLDA